MIKLDTYHSTLITNGLYSANQPIIVSLTDDSNPTYLSVVLSDTEFVAYRIEDRYEFNLTEYVRSQFKYQNTEVSNAASINFYIDSSVYVEIDMIDFASMLNGSDSILVTKIPFVNCEVDREYDILTSYASRGFFTSREYLEYWDTNPRYLYFQNRGSIWTESNTGWGLTDISTIDAKVLGIDYTKYIAISTDVQEIRCKDNECLKTLYTENTTGQVTVDYRGYSIKRANSNILNEIPPVIIYKNMEEFDPEDYSVDDIILLPKGTTEFVIPNDYDGFAVIASEWDYVNRNLGSALTYSTDLTIYVPYYHIVTEDEDYEAGSYLPIYRKVDDHNSYEIKYINRYGGWDYYRFDHKRLHNHSTEERKTLNKIKESLFDSRRMVYKIVRNNTISLKSNTETMPQYKSISFAPFSTKIMHLITANNQYRWEEVFIEDFELSYRPCENAGSIEIEITNNNQYTLANV